MATSGRFLIGAPGIYSHPEVPLRVFTGVRLDVTAFVGVAPRGPARVPVINEQFRDDAPCVEPERPRRRSLAVAVESFDEYKLLYGAFEGPGLLPYAVASFFEQGGRRAYIVRIVHDYDRDNPPAPQANESGVAAGVVPGASPPSGLFTLRARSEGIWGNQLRARLGFTRRPMLFDPAKATLTGLELPAGTTLPQGTLLRLRVTGGKYEFRFVDAVFEELLARRPGSAFSLIFHQPATGAPEAAEVVEASLTIEDGAGLLERHERLGLAARHPRWLATVVCYESQLVYPEASWAFDRLTPDEVALIAGPQFSEWFTGGADRYEDITPEDFFDSLWTPGDEEPGSGLHSLTNLSDLSLVVVPDLYSPKALAERHKLEDPVSLAGPSFTPCVKLPTNPPPLEEAPPDLIKLRLDPKVPADLEKITSLQLRLVELAEHLRSWVVLLDVPPELTPKRLLNWRNHFDSSYAAAYHPWLATSRRDDSRDALIPLPPAAVAAGIIAKMEYAFGIPHGPANVLAAEVMDVADRVSSTIHDELHPLGINVFLSERDGVRLTAARTLSTDPRYRQLSVRRLLLLIRRTIEQQVQWAVFEPNNGNLRIEVRQWLSLYLRQMWLAGAFKGPAEEDSFFVRCDESNNPPHLTDTGQLIVEIGVAPAEPLEFIILRLWRGGDGTLTIVETGGR